MNVKSPAGTAILAACLASAAAPATTSQAPAGAPRKHHAASEVPLEVPLSPLGRVLPLEPPTGSAGVPAPVPGMPRDAGRVGEGGLPELLVPGTPVAAALPSTNVTAPLPGLLGGRPLRTAMLTSPRSAVESSTPGATLREPLGLRQTGAPAALPELRAPRAALLGPAVSGAVAPGLTLLPSTSWARFAQGSEGVVKKAFLPPPAW
ncbi:hypothetical protein [Streptomyces thermolilacinus]|uniref:hypothetical protein n=1 Tax=Streptomyces thermolilacinus TaxID=285540 RepID=UPI0033C0E68A